MSVMNQTEPKSWASAEPVPLFETEGGAVRIGSSRITLDLVVEQYENGMSPEDLERAYDGLQLADIHSVIAFYLRHPEQVQEYLKQRRAAANHLQNAIETERPRVTLDELLARRRESQNPSPLPAGERSLF
jgi:uncharacterized protein (DUF433 family)